MSLDPELKDGDGVGTEATDGANPNPSTGSSTIDAPGIKKDGQLDLEKRSVKTISHAWNICKATEHNNRTRALRTADIQAIYDGEPPHSPAAQREKAKSWQSNASTNWLAGIVGRQAQRFVTATVSQLYITQSQVPDSYAEAKAHGDLLCSEFTKLVRSWDGYTGIINSLAVENTLQGYTYALFLDPYTWKPTMFRQDRCFVPELSGEHANDLQYIVAKMDYRLDEFLELFSDVKDAEGEKRAGDVGYNLENCIWAANNAKEQSTREDAQTTEYRKFVDMINEGILGISFSATGARIVSTYMLFNKEYDGKVSFWLIAKDSGKLLRFSFKLFDSMADALTVFYFEPGNGCIHSSKGLGRKLAALAIMKEVFRNGVIDNARMASLVIIRVDAKDKNRLAPSIISPFIVLDKSVDVEQTQFQISAESQQVVDNLIDAWAEQAVGAYISGQVSPEGKTEKTATEATIDAKRAQEASDIQIRRWLDLMANMTQIQQHRAFSDDNIKAARRLFEDFTKNPSSEKPDAYEGHENIDADVLRSLVKVMRAGVLDDEIKLWRDSPANPFAHVQDTAVLMGVPAVVAQYGAKPGVPGDPNVNQPELVKLDLATKIGPELAKALFIPNADQTLTAEAVRQQLIESSTMYDSGMMIGVSPRDNHLIHGKVVQDLLTKLAAPMISNTPNLPPQVESAVQNNLNHLGAHLQAASATGLAKSPQFAELNKFYEGFKKQLQQVAQIKASAEAAHNAVVNKIRAEGLPPDAGVGGGAGASAPAPTPGPGAQEDVSAGQAGTPGVAAPSAP